MLASIQRLDWKALDLRAIAEPLAVLSPLALIVGGQEFVMAGVALLFLARSWREQDFAWMRERWFAALLALWTYALARTILIQPTATGVLTGLQWIHFGIYAAALARWILPDPRARDRLLDATAIALTFLACDGLLQYVVGYDIVGRPVWANRLTGVFGKPYLGIEIAWLYLPALLGLWRRGRPRLAAAFGCLCAATVLLSGDRMGLIVFLASGLLAGLFTPALRKPLLIFVPVVGVLAGALLALSPTLYQRQVRSTLAVITHLDQSHYGLIFSTGVAIVRDHPLLGVGVHRYQAVCLDERYGPVLVGPDALPRCEGHPHNIALQWLAETGAIGLAGYVAFMALALAALWRGARANPANAVFHGLAAALALRFWPLSASTSFYSSWSAEPLFLVLGWALSYCAPLRRDPAPGERPARAAEAETLHAS